MTTAPRLRRRAVVIVCQNAFYDMALATIESALIPPTLLDDSLKRLAIWEQCRVKRRSRADALPPTLIFSRTGLETAGLLFGQAAYSWDCTQFVVERMFPVTTQRSDRSVGHSEESAELLADWAWALNAPYQLIGGFHSHPLMEKDLDEIEACQLYGPSFEDLYGGPSFPANNFGLIVAIARAGTDRSTSYPPPVATKQFSVGAFEMWISAYSKTFDIIDLTIDRPSGIRDPNDSPLRFENWFPATPVDGGN